MKEIVVAFLLVSVTEGRHFWGTGPFHAPNGQVHYQSPDGTFHQAGHPCPGHSCSPPGHNFPPPGHNFPPPGHNFPPQGSRFPPPRVPSYPVPGLDLAGLPLQNWYQQSQQGNAIDVSNAEWVCTNPRTNDMMIITASDVEPSETNKQSSNESPVPNAGHENQHNDHVTPTVQPITTESTSTHGGEGLIDVRFGR